MVVSPVALTEPTTTVRSSAVGIGGAITFFVQLPDANTIVINAKQRVKNIIAFLMISKFE
jgi:hypothetical protein